MGIYELVKKYMKAEALKPPADLEDERTLSFATFKDAGSMKFVMTYSNNLLDDDWPRQIIAKDAHLAFEKELKEGEAPYPEAWLWHEPLWKFGQTTGMAVVEDEGGDVMTVVVGTVDKGVEHIVSKFNPPVPLAVSHGMPPNTVAVEGDVIVRYRSVEVSALPRSRAANKVGTEFQLLKESKMPEDKVKELATALGVDEATLTELAQTNLAQISASNRPSKEASEPTATDMLTKAEAQAMFGDVVRAIGDILAPLQKQVGVLALEVNALKKEAVPQLSLYDQIVKAANAGKKADEDEEEEEMPTTKSAGPRQTAPKAGQQNLGGSAFLSHLVNHSQGVR